MKRTLLLLLFVIATIGAKAQDFKGKRSIGLSLGYNDLNQSIGSVSLDSIPPEENKRSILPGFTYFVSNKWSIGVQGRYSQSTDEQIINNYKSHLRDVDFGIETFATYHYWLNEHIALLAEPVLGYSIDKYKITRELTGIASSQEEVTANYLYIKGRIGVLFTFQRFGIDLSTSLGSRGVYSLKASYNYHDRLNKISDNTSDSSMKSLAWGEKKNVRVGIKYFF